MVATRKAATLYLRISADLYDALVKAADKGNRPIAAQAEMLLKRQLKVTA